MDAGEDEVAVTLDWIIDRVSNDLENNKIEEISQCDLITSIDDSNEERSCRICYDLTLVPIIYPCRCKGTMGAIHLICLERWLEESNRNSCELCGYQFDIERTPRYSALHSIIIWICTKQPDQQLFVRNIRVDLIRCMIATPLTLGSTYVCIVAADFYSTNNYDNFPPARWTTYSLVAMMLLVVFSYFAWMYMALQYHQRVWFYWWQKTSVVKLRHHHTSMEDVNKSLTMYRSRMSHGILPV